MLPSPRATPFSSTVGAWATILVLLAGLAGCRTEACTNPDITLPITITVRLEVYQRLVPDGAAPPSAVCTTLCQAFEPTMVVVDSCEAGEPNFPDGGPDTASVTGIATIPVSCWGRFPCPLGSP